MGRLGIQLETNPRPRRALVTRGSVETLGSGVHRRWPSAAARAIGLAPAAGIGGLVSSAELVGWKVIGGGVGLALGVLGLFPLVGSGFWPLGLGLLVTLFL